jgi:hypothetical protein
MPETNSGFHQQINNLSQDNEVKDMRHCQDEMQSREENQEKKAKVCVPIT